MNIAAFSTVLPQHPSVTSLKPTKWKVSKYLVLKCYDDNTSISHIPKHKDRNYCDFFNISYGPLCNFCYFSSYEVSLHHRNVSPTDVCWEKCLSLTNRWTRKFTTIGRENLRTLTKCRSGMRTYLLSSGRSGILIYPLK